MKVLNSLRTAKETPSRLSDCEAKRTAVCDL